MTTENTPGQKLRDARQKAGVKQQALAEIVGTNKGNLSNMERGNRAIPAALAYKLELALDMEPYELLREAVPTPASLRSAVYTIPGYVCRLMAARPPALARLANTQGWSHIRTIPGRGLVSSAGLA